VNIDTAPKYDLADVAGSAIRNARGGVHVRTNAVITTGRRRRRHHSDLFKAEAVRACQQEGVSVALARGVTRVCCDAGWQRQNLAGRRLRFSGQILSAGSVHMRGYDGVLLHYLSILNGGFGG